LRGPVVTGFQRGRTLGTPTANLQCNDQLIPADGIYAGRCIVDSRTYPAAVSIGDMPTFGGNVRQIEAHLLDFEGDLYGQSLASGANEIFQRTSLEGTDRTGHHRDPAENRSGPSPADCGGVVA
jgi:hypothetical protein